MLFENKKVIVTGAGQSIGRKIAEQFAGEGADVLISYRSNESNAQEVVAAINKTGVRGFSLAADFAQNGAVEHFFKTALNLLGSVDILINNAGVLSRETLLTLEPAKLQTVYQVNTLAPLILAQHCALHMIENKVSGGIINISSISGQVTMKKGIAYASSKAALNKWTENAAIDLAPFGIRVNAVAPGVVESGMNATTKTDNPELWQYYQQRIPLGKMGAPTDIASMVLYLASHQADWITGKIFDVDGGHATLN